MTVALSVCSMSFCCGVKEAGDFGDDFGDYRGNTWQEVLDRLFSSQKGFSIQFWFVKGHKWDGTYMSEFDNEDLRTIITQLPEATMMAAYKNPNTGNWIEGWIVNNTNGITL